MNEAGRTNGYELIDNVMDLKEKVLTSEKAAVIYYGKKGAIPDAVLLEELAFEVGSFINCAIFTVDDTKDLEGIFKGKLPQFRYYPNVKTDEAKIQASNEILFFSGSNS